MDTTIGSPPRLRLNSAKTSAHRHARQHRGQRADKGRAREIGAKHGGEGAGQHEALQRDVEDAGAFAQRTAEGCEQDRRDEARHGG